MSRYAPLHSTNDQQQSGNPARDLIRLESVRIFLFLAAHMVLVIVLKQNSLLATIHALVTFLIAFYISIKDKTSIRVTYLIAYIVGFDLVWRGSGALIFWESSKYMTILLCGLSLLKENRFRSSAKLPIIYFLLHIPSVFILPYFDRNDIAFNMSGGAALAAATVYFSTIALTRSQFKTVILALLGPIVGLGALSLYGIATSETFQFLIGSKSTSGGIGPNQVSSMLGMGMFIATIYFFLETKSKTIRVGMLICAFWLAVQAAVTTSRGGFYTGIGACIILGFYLIRTPTARRSFIAGLIITASLSYFIVIPQLNALTNGGFLDRIQSTDLTGRDLIIEADLLAFQEFPLFGLGPGQSYDYHAITFKPTSPHTEYTRLLAEHGSLGLFAVLLLFLISLGRIAQPNKSLLAKGIIVSSTAWLLLYMVHAAMRLAAPAFLFGLGAAQLILNEDVEDTAIETNTSKNDF